MTDLFEQRLRSAMSPPDSVDPAGSSSDVDSSADGGSTDGRSVCGGSSELERWSQIEAAAQRRKDRSDLSQRVAMVASVFLVAGSALALGSGSLFGSTEAGRGPGTDSEVGGSTDHTIWRWLFVLGLTVALGNSIALLWRRIPDWYFSFEPSPTGRWGRILGTIIVLGGLALPLWAFTNFALKQDKFAIRMGMLDEELYTVSRHSSVLPVFSSSEPTVWVEVVPSKPNGDTLLQVRLILIGQGFKIDEAADPRTLSRQVGTDPNWTGEDHLSLTPISDGLVLIEARTSAAGLGRDRLPLATVTGFTLVALGAILAWYGTLVGSWLGGLLLSVSALQAGLALRALFQVRALFAQFDQVVDMSRSDPDFLTFRRQVEDVGGDLYPFGSGSLIFLLLPWIAGSILVFESKPRARAWSVSIGLAATVATWVTFQSIDADLNNLFN